MGSGDQAFGFAELGGPRPEAVRWTRRRLGHSCRAVGLAVAIAGLMGCTTTTRLGPAGDPATVRAIEELATKPNAYTHVAQPPPAVQPIYRVDEPSPIVAHEPGWLTIYKQGAPVRVPLTEIRSVSTYDHVHGALDGAAVGGAIGFTLGFAAGSLLIWQTCNADSSCDTSIPAATRLRRGTAVGAVSAAVTAVLGAAIGAIQGHETRYEIAPP